MATDGDAARMSLQETVSGWLTALGQPLGLQLALDGSGAAGLALAGGVNLIVEVEEALDAVHLYAELLRLPDDAAHRAVLLEAAMALNLHTRQTEGATLGLDRRSDALVLSIMRDGASLDDKEFGGALAAFGETAQRLRNQLRSSSDTREEPAHSLHPSPFLDPRFLA